MGELATALKNLPAQIQEHQYSYGAFGSWWVTLRYEGTWYRLVFDGRDSRVMIECSTVADARSWDKTIWERSSPDGRELPVIDMADAIQRFSLVARG